MNQTTSTDPPKPLTKFIGKIAVFLSLGLGVGLIVVHAVQSDWLAPVTMVPAWMWLISVGMLII